MIALSWIGKLGRHALQQKWAIIDGRRTRLWERELKADAEPPNPNGDAEALLVDMAQFHRYGERGLAYYINPQDIVLIARLCRSIYFVPSLDGDALGGLQTDRGMLMIFKNKLPPVPPTDPPGYTGLTR